MAAPPSLLTVPEARAVDPVIFMTDPVVTTAGKGERTLRKRAALRVWPAALRAIRE
jgi:hypothetical protein